MADGGLYNGNPAGYRSFSLVRECECYLNGCGADAPRRLSGLGDPQVDERGDRGAHAHGHDIAVERGSDINLESAGKCSA